MRIRSIEAIPLSIGFKVTHSFGTIDRKQSHNVILRLTTDEGIVGYGEACPVPAFSGETQESIVALLDQRVKDVLIGQDPMNREPIIRSLERRLFGCPFTLAAIDIALWDVAGKALGVPVSTLLGGRFRDQLTLHGSVGIGTPEFMVDLALTQSQLGYRSSKLYAGRDPLAVDLHRLRAVREALGPEVDFILDINGMWDVTTCLQALPALAELGVTLLEQPLPAWDELGQAEVMRASTIDIAADESVFSAADVARIARQRTARVINLGLSKLGGLLRARECAAVARANGLGVVVGSVLELNIANAAGMHLAASLPELAHPSYVLGPIKYEHQIATEPLIVENGEVRVPDGPGLGIEIDEEMLRSLDLRGRV